MRTAAGIRTNRLAVFGIILIVGCNTVNSNSVDIAQADAAYAAGRFAEAEQLYRDVLVSDPANARAFELLGTIAIWKNDLTVAETNLNAAQRNKSWFLRFWPLNIQTNVHMALVQARVGHLRAASTLLDKAAGPLPFGPLKEIRVRAQQLALFDTDAPYRIEGAAATTVPFVVTDPLPVVKVAINGAAPTNFFIDTGGEGVILDSAFAKQVGAAIVGEVPQEYAGGKKGLTGYGKVDAVQLGDVTVRNVPVSCIDLQPTASSVFAGREIKGVIGTGFLMQFLATLDYPGQQLVLRPSSGTARDVDQSLGVTSRDSVFRMWLVETHLIFSEGSVNQLEPGMMLIDTGLADAGFLASRDIFTEAGVTMDWRKAFMGAGGGGMAKGLNVTVPEVTLGRGDNAIRKRELRGVVMEDDMSLFKDVLGFKVRGLISHLFFREHAVTFDFRNMRLILQQR